MSNVISFSNFKLSKHDLNLSALCCISKEIILRTGGYSYSIMLSALCRNGLLREAKELAKDFEVNFAKYDLVMSNTLLRVYCNVGDMDSAMQMLRKMDELRISPDWNTFQILIKYFCRERLYHLAFQTTEDMYKKGHQLDEVKILFKFFLLLVI